MSEQKHRIFIASTDAANHKTFPLNDAADVDIVIAHGVSVAFRSPTPGAVDQRLVIDITPEKREAGDE